MSIKGHKNVLLICVVAAFEQSAKLQWGKQVFDSLLKFSHPERRRGL